MSAISDLEAEAAAVLSQSWGGGDAEAVGAAPGRVTLVGEHVDYVGGKIACMAVDRAVAVALRRSSDGHWRVVSDGRRIERTGPTMAADIGDRILAAAVILSRRGIDVPAVEVGVAATLPSGSGLSSSAAVTCATLVALLRLTTARMTADELVAAAHSAERDIVGVPVGELDQRAVVHSAERAVLLLDCGAGSRRLISWPWEDIGLVVAGSGESHDVGDGAYAERRADAERACARLGVATCQEIGDRWRDLPEVLQPRARHIATETRRTDAAVRALGAGDAVELGRLLSASHASLRDDYAVSTPCLDAMAAAAEALTGCHGARMVGAGFGGSVIALVDLEAAEATAAAMARASGGGPESTWLVRPAAGVETLAADVISATETAGAGRPASSHTGPSST